MKINWRIPAAIVIIVVVAIWMFDTLRLRDYAGGNLNVNIGHGLVTLTNPSAEPIPAQLFSSGARSFTVSSPIEEMSGTSTRVGSGTTATQTFAFDVPPGSSTILVPRGTNVSLMTDTDARLEVLVDTQSGSEAQTIRIVGIVIMVIALFLIYRTVRGDQKLALRRQEIADAAAKPVMMNAVRDANKGRDGRAYSDS